MTKVTITKKDGKTGVVLGTREVEKPDNWKEFLETFDEQQIMTYTWSAFVIAVQRELDSRKAPVNENVSKFKALSPEKQLEALRKLGIVS